MTSRRQQRPQCKPTRDYCTGEAARVRTNDVAELYNAFRWQSLDDIIYSECLNGAAAVVHKRYNL